MQGHSNQIKGKLKQDLKTTVIANWKLWVPFQFLNFRFIPGNLQVSPSSNALEDSPCGTLSLKQAFDVGGGMKDC